MHLTPGGSVVGSSGFEVLVLGVVEHGGVLEVEVGLGGGLLDKVLFSHEFYRIILIINIEGKC